MSTDSGELSLRRVLRRVSLFDWWFERVPVYPLVICRIGFGLILYFAYTLYFPHSQQLWGAEGLFRYAQNLEVSGIVLTHTRLVYTLLLASSLAFAFGLFTRAAGVTALLCHAAIVGLGYHHTWGWAPTIIPLLGYVVLSPCGARYSVDAWLRKRRGLEPAPDSMMAWPQRLLLVHMLCIYFAAAWHRLDDGAWLEGEAVFVAVTSSTFSRFPTTDFHHLRGPLWLACWVAWLFELAAPLALLIPRVRTVVALGLVAMHIGLELTSCVGWWQLVLSVALMTVLPPAWSQRLLERAAGFFRRKSPRASA